jgi:hypothetical protein
VDLRSVQHVGIIGAGVAGLATAKILQAEGLDCTIFERAERLGGVWAGGYSNFGVQVQKELYQFPDWPLPEGTPNFTPGPIFQKYLEDYADRFQIRSRIRLGARGSKKASLVTIAKVVYVAGLPRTFFRLGAGSTIRRQALTKDEAPQIAANVAKLPEPVAQIRFPTAQS